MIALSKVTLTPIGLAPRMLRMLIICIEAPGEAAGQRAGLSQPAPPPFPSLSPDCESRAPVKSAWLMV